MSTTTAPAPATPSTPTAEHHTAVGPIGRVGRYTATHFRTVLIGWAVVAVVLGFFAPKVETALSGAGWEASGSQSAQARKLVEKDFAGLGSYGLMTVVYSHRNRRLAGIPVGNHARGTDAARKQRGPDCCRACGGAVDLPRRAHRDRAGRCGRDRTKWSPADSN